jgi:hypothetical protein
MWYAGSIKFGASRYIHEIYRCASQNILKKG